MKENKIFIENKVEQLKKALVEQEKDPVFIVTAELLSVLKKGRMMVNFTPFFFSDDDTEMRDEQKMLILNFLEVFIRDERQKIEAKK